MAADYYKTLGIDRGADLAEVRAAYRRAVLKCHPDVFTGGQREAERLFRKVTAAYKAILRKRGQRRMGPHRKTFSPQDLAIMEMARSATGKSAPPQRSAPPQKTAKPETISFAQFAIAMAITFTATVYVVLGLNVLASLMCVRSSDRHIAPGESITHAHLISLDLGKAVTMELVLIPAGKFTMGSPDSEEGRSSSEGPQHEVTISKPFYMGAHEVTQEQYEAVIGSHPSKSHFIGATNPVEMVSWEDAVAFCHALFRKTGKTVNLPTEAQWEYACRAGSKTRFSFSDSDAYLHRYGNYCDKSNTDYLWWQDKAHNDGHDKTASVGSFWSNAFGLYDMHGNVWEWCNDWYADSYANAKNVDPAGPDSGSLRVLRGGGWGRAPALCRSAFRYGGTRAFRYLHVGFRVSVDLK